MAISVARHLAIVNMCKPITAEEELACDKFLILVWQRWPSRGHRLSLWLQFLFPFSLALHGPLLMLPSLYIIYQLSINPYSYLSLCLWKLRLALFSTGQFKLSLVAELFFFFFLMLYAVIIHFSLMGVLYFVYLSCNQ